MLHASMCITWFLIMGTDWKQLTHLPVEAMPTFGELNIKQKTCSTVASLTQRQFCTRGGGIIITTGTGGTTGIWRVETYSARGSPATENDPAPVISGAEAEIPRTQRSIGRETSQLRSEYDTRTDRRTDGCLQVPPGRGHGR